MVIAAEFDVAQVITAAAGLVTAIGWAYTQIRTHSTVKKIDQSVGTSNGSDLVTMALQLATLEKYTHDAVHDLKSMMVPVAALAPTDPQLLNDAVANKIAERTTDTQQ